jgi:replicative DNA helicase
VSIPHDPQAADKAAEALRNIEARDAARQANVDPDTDAAFDALYETDIEPLPLVDRETAPTWPVEILPAWIADHAIDTADRLQVPVDLCCQLAVGVLSAACMGRATVAVDDWKEPSNLYLWCAMHSGAGKSPAEKAMVGALRDYERQCRLDSTDAHALAVAAWKVAQKKMRKAEDAYAVGSIGQTEFEAAVLEASESFPAEYRLLIDDATPERLVQLLGAHKRLALISTEAGLLDQVAGQFAKGQKPNIDVYLKAWAGETIIRDRKGGDDGPESTVVEDALLTVLLTIQPGVIENYRRTAPELRGRGFFARFMPSIPSSLVGTRTFGNRPPVADSADIYTAEVARLAGRMASTTGDILLRLDADAAALFYAWCDAMEADLGPGGRLSALHDAASKIRSSALRTAGLLTLADGHNGPWVGADVMQRALTVADYWVAHALLLEDDSDPENEYAVDVALDIANWCRRRQVTEFTPREVWLSLRRKYTTVEALVPGFELLWERLWLTFVEGHPTDIGVQKRKVRARVDARLMHSADLRNHGRRHNARYNAHIPKRGEMAITPYIDTSTQQEQVPPESARVARVTDLDDWEPPEDIF